MTDERRCSEDEVREILAGMGSTALGYNALTLPPWAGRRERQFEYIAARARALTGDETPAPLPEREDA